MKPKKGASKIKSSSYKRGEKETVRLNKFLSNAGICSRREADENIKMGLVHVNGKVVTEMGFQVGPTDEVKFDGSRIQKTAPLEVSKIIRDQRLNLTFRHAPEILGREKEFETFNYSKSSCCWIPWTFPWYFLVIVVTKQKF